MKDIRFWCINDHRFILMLIMLMFNFSYSYFNFVFFCSIFLKPIEKPIEIRQRLVTKGFALRIQSVSCLFSLSSSHTLVCFADHTMKTISSRGTILPRAWMLPILCILGIEKIFRKSIFVKRTYAWQTDENSISGKLLLIELRSMI